MFLLWLPSVLRNPERHRPYGILYGNVTGGTYTNTIARTDIGARTFLSGRGAIDLRSLIPKQISSGDLFLRLHLETVYSCCGLRLCSGVRAFFNVAEHQNDGK